MLALSNLTSLFMFMLVIMKVSSNYETTKYNPTYPSVYPDYEIQVAEEDIDRMQFTENMEFLEAAYFLNSAFGYGLDVIAPELVMGGPRPIGVQRANLDKLVLRIIQEFGLQEVGHLRALQTTVGGFPRPLMDLSPKVFAEFFDLAFGYRLEPPFNPYRDSLSFMLSVYIMPYAALVNYAGTNQFLIGNRTKELLAGLMGVAAGQDAVTRMYLYERNDELVYPYDITVAEFTIRISMFKNRLAGGGIRDEGLVVPLSLGAENRTTSNVISADYNSLTYRGTPEGQLRIVYLTGNESIPGGFFPNGANGRIARNFLARLKEQERI